MANIQETESIEVNTTNVTVVVFVLVLLFLIGVYLQVRIIMVSKQDKEMTWKIDIGHSVVMIIYYAFQISFETSVHVIPKLTQVTGSWFCHFAKFIKLYGMVAIVGHSLFIALHKYLFIIHDEKIRKFGMEKAKKISLWIYILHPAIGALAYMVRPHFRAISSINRCHGLHFLDPVPVLNETTSFTFKVWAEKFFFCGLGDYDYHNSFDYFVYLTNQAYCFLQVIGTCLIVGNIIEIYLYKNIFDYVKR